tara:strand:+ start:672 stop:1808 length:1137 start_codon:yes stop_codon:yes gene_type:complete
MNSFNDAVKNLNFFVDNDILNYSSTRNYDFGPNKRNNVSMLSKFISHRIISEYDVINTALSKNSYSSIEKFIQEVFWRIYWKGWLEHRPLVWVDYYNFNHDSYDLETYHDAENANTKIDCFNHWMRELQDTNYLHNHTRMWFASVWIFTLKLPWELGANLFMKYLYDGDAASNTLSWRWVAGLQTAGKHYVATSQNISKYTKQRFKPLNLHENAKPIHSDKLYNIEELKMFNNTKLNNSLIIFDNNLDSKNNKKLTDKYKNIYLLSLDNDARRIKLCEEVLSFKNLLLNDYSNTMTNSKVLSSSELLSVIEKERSVDVLYPGIGENLSFIKKFSSTTTLNYIYNEKDLFCWKFSKKGFFNFKKNIPDILKKLLIIEDF